MFLLRKTFFLVIIPDKFHYNMLNLLFLFGSPIRCVRSIATSVKSITRSLCVTQVYLYLHYYSVPHHGWVSNFNDKIALADQCFLQNLDLSVKADTFSCNFFFNAFIFFLTFFLILIKLICNKFDLLWKISEWLFTYNIRLSVLVN